MAYKHEETHKQILSSYHAYLGDDSGEKEIDEVYDKAKAFNEIVEVFKDYPLKTDSDVMDFIQAKLDELEDK